MPKTKTKTTHTNAHRELVKMLIAARQKMGLGQKETAKIMGHSQTWIARLETCQRRIDVVEFVQLAALLQIDPHKVLHMIEQHVECWLKQVPHRKPPRRGGAQNLAEA